MNVVRTIGTEADPAKRLRKKWGDEMRYTRTVLRGWTLEDVASRFAELGYQITPQAISQWELGVTSPRRHFQIAWCKVMERRHHEVFVMEDEAA